MNKKNYEKWHELKGKINAKSIQLYFHEREIWFCSLGVNVGFEQDGKNELFERPVLVFKKFNERVFWGIPLTSSLKRGMYYYNYKYRGKYYAAILSQIRLFDSKRLTRKAGLMMRKQFEELKFKFYRLI